MSLSHAPLAIVILAAGKGTRMKSDFPKVLHPLAHRPMILHVLDVASSLNPEKIVLITGHGADQVEETVHATYPETKFIEQKEQLGTGHATLQAEEVLAGFKGDTLVLYGDVPLLDANALQAFLEVHRERENIISSACAQVENPTGLGRILRDETGTFLGNREHKDCTEEELKICEISVGIYVGKNSYLFDLLKKIKNGNSQGEYYLPDIIHLGLEAGLQVDALPFPQEAKELCGINNRIQLAEAEACFQNRYRAQHMLNGVTLQDPATTYFSWDTQIGEDVTIGPNVVFGPGVKVADHVEIKAFSHIERTKIENRCQIGPFARLRPETLLKTGSKVGNFVEIKKSTIGKDTKINHLSYFGDATLGENVNVGAGTITANYDRRSGKKSETIIGDQTSIGAHNTFVAPVTLGKNVYTGAATVIRNNVDDNQLAVTKAEVKIKPRP